MMPSQCEKLFETRGTFEGYFALYMAKLLESKLYMVKPVDSKLFGKTSRIKFWVCTC